MCDLLDGMAWLRLPMPGALNHVNVWLMDGGDHLAAIDAGFPHPQATALWDKALANKTLREVFITHCHPDHLGLSGWLEKTHGVKTFYITPDEEALARRYTDDAAVAASRQTHYDGFIASGLDSALVDAMMQRMSRYKDAVGALPASGFRNIAGGDTVSLAGHDWRVIEGYGHSPQHASLYDAARDIFIAGDQVLPYISPNISLGPRDAAGADPLGGYIESLGRIKTEVPDSALVLPSHGVPFHGLHARIDALVAHHERRLDETLAIVGDHDGATGAEVMTQLFSGREFGPGDVFFALGEAMSHVRYLTLRGKIAETRDGAVTRFMAA